MLAPELICRIVEQKREVMAVFFEGCEPVLNHKERKDLFEAKDFLYHEKNYLSFWLDKKNLNIANLQEIINKVRLGDWILSITSKIVLKNNESFCCRHLPMIDFDCLISRSNLIEIKNFLKKIDQKGYILESGRSYHFYGLDLMTDKQWLEFLGKCLLFKNYVDARYVGHRLIRGYSALRISANSLRTRVPEVVAMVD